MHRFLSCAVLLALCATSACRPLTLYGVNPEGPPEYKLGWEDGCDSSVGANGGAIYRMTYGFKKRPEMMNNPIYNTGWNEGFTYCRTSMDPVDKSGWYN